MTPGSMHQRLGLTCVLLAAGALPARAQQFAVAPHVGSMGLGADFAVALNHFVGFRAGANIFPFDLSITPQNVEYSLSFPSPQFLAVVDVSILGPLRVSGGARFSAQDFELTGKLAEPVQIGSTTYTPDEVGTLTGTFGTNNVSPYVGVGLGNASGRGRIGFLLDLGVAFHGTPQVSASADGPVASLPGFQQDLATEVQDIQNDVDGVTIYPVIALGLVFRLRP